ncbi:tyrosine-type recombinase/integrase [Bacillus sp. NEB1478]|uniref:tyrosine-type recombinase/integrase n=1 Tax=Bacillus sp. NEB1478 TaxID=3073816 RepID=UPI002873A469|nr:tyrosine-type recombinase/integrase [Bacillus sp. NEB1478]WNB90820.1 tyrosine-type recombinase/integrase [Bacillus sp. NEB1478]
MEYVEALRDIKQINAIKRYLKKQSERDYVLFVFGINTGLKITEILSIKVDDVMEEDFMIKPFYCLSSKEAEISKDIYLNETVRKILQHYILHTDLNCQDYLFSSRKTKLPISRQQAYRIIHQAAEEVGIKGKIGTNSMRKTFGFHAYKRGIAISLLQKHFNHSSPSETLKYLGISKEEKIKTEIDVRL